MSHLNLGGFGLAAWTAAKAWARTTSTPFLFHGTSFTLAQNGDLHDFSAMRYDLLDHVDPRLVPLSPGATPMHLSHCRRRRRTNRPTVFTR